jgi:arylsulfatase A-like enzyme
MADQFTITRTGHKSKVLHAVFHSSDIHPTFIQAAGIPDILGKWLVIGVAAAKVPVIGGCILGKVLDKNRVSVTNSIGNMKIKNLRILQGKIPEIISNKYNKIFTFENGLQSLVEVSD